MIQLFKYSFVSSFQVIIPGIWILAAISKIPRFIKRSRFAKENMSNYCISLLTEEGVKALFTVYISINSVLFIFLVLLYSKVVYSKKIIYTNVSK